MVLSNSTMAADDGRNDKNKTNGTESEENPVVLAEEVF